MCVAASEEAFSLPGAEEQQLVVTEQVQVQYFLIMLACGPTKFFLAQNHTDKTSMGAPGLVLHDALMQG